MDQNDNFIRELNFLHDDLMPLRGKEALNPSELRVATVILRQMQLARSPAIELSYADIMRLTGLTKDGVAKGLNRCRFRKFVIRTGRLGHYFYTFRVVSETDFLNIPSVIEADFENEGEYVETDCSEEASDGESSTPSKVSKTDQSAKQTSQQNRPAKSAKQTSLHIYEKTRGFAPKTNARARASPDSDAVLGFLEAEWEAAFDRVWEAWPEEFRNWEDRARIVWRNLNPRPTVEEVLASIQLNKQGKKWAEGFVPNLDNWLSDRGWKRGVVLIPKGVNSQRLSVRESNIQAMQENNERILRGESSGVDELFNGVFGDG